MEKTCIETIARPHGIESLHFRRRRCESLFSPLRLRTLVTEFDHYYRNHGRQFFHGDFQIACAADPLRLARIRQKNIDVTQRLLQSALPSVIRIVICIERGGQTSFFHGAEQFRNSRPQLALQIEGRDMEVPGIG